MDLNLKRFVEPLEHDIDVRHKISPGTEKRNYHLHQQLEIVYVVSDNVFCRFEQNGEKVGIPKDSILLLDTMTLHYMFTEPLDLRCDRYILYFHPKLIMDLQLPQMNLLESFYVRKDIRESFFTVPEGKRPGIKGILETMCDAFSAMEQEKEQVENEVMLKMNLVQILIEIKRMHAQRLKELGVPVDREYLSMSRLGSEIRDFIRENATKEISVEEICHQFLIGKQRLYELFDKLYGITVAQYRTMCR
ncbi:MAG: helix-turn-helix transcriptional regulator, partial [Spirochaetales bacterium]|nr:helix-turn-helix transcriptional regulator [Spirochaetales bacterium]